MNKGKNWNSSNFIKYHVFNNEAFVAERPPSKGKLGTHSFHKFATTLARMSDGPREDDVD